MNDLGINSGINPLALNELLGVDPQQLENKAAQFAAAGVWSPGTLGQLMTEISRLVRKSIGDDKGDSVSDANGAPALALPLTDFSGDELALILQAIDTKVKDTQARTTKEGIEHARQQTETANKAMLDKLQEVVEKQKEAAEKEKANKVWGWIGKIAAVIGAIVAVVTAAVATVASGGAAAPLLALAVIGMVAATVDLANQINQEVHPDAEPFTLGSLIGDAIIEAMDAAGIEGKGRAAASGLAAALGFLLMQPDMAGQMAADAAIADGKSQDFADQVKMGVMYAAVATTLIVMIAATVASGGSASANLVNSTAKMLMKAAQYIGAINGVIQGAAAVGGGVNSALIAVDQKAADEARARAKELDAVLVQLQQQTDEMTAKLKEIIEALQEGTQMFTQMVAAAADQRANTIRNLVQG